MGRNTQLLTTHEQIYYAQVLIQQLLNIFRYYLADKDTSIYNK